MIRDSKSECDPPQKSIDPANERNQILNAVREMRLPYLRLSVTPHCDANCNFCHNEGQRIGLRGEATALQSTTMNERQYIEIAQMFLGILPRISLTGGEPTLVRNLDVIANIFASRGYTVNMTTNGFNFNESLQLRMKHAGLSGVNVSLHSLNPKHHAEVFGVQNKLDVVLNNLATMGRHFPDKVKLNFMALPGQNVPDQLEPITYFAGQHNLTVSFMSLVKDRSTEPPLSSQVIDILTARFGIRNITTHNDKFGKRYIYTFRNGARWEFDDFRQQSYRDDVFDNLTCQSCVKQAVCTEGPYALRVKHDGTLKPCLIRSDNEVSFQRYTTTNRA